MAAASSPSVRASEINADFTQLVYEILRSFEKDQITDASHKIRESQDTEKKVVELNEKLQQVRDQILKLPGIDLSKSDQLNRLEALKQQLSMKKELLEKYRGMCSFDSNQEAF